MFSDGEERFCIPGLSRMVKNHTDTFWRHQKDTLIWIQKGLKTGQKEGLNGFFLAGYQDLVYWTCRNNKEE